jgi:two-component system, NarL family, captular synthesis response regulator RcsB
MAQRIRIIVADDHAVVREGIRLWLENNAHIEVVATAVDAQSLADHIDHFECDVVVSDIGMRGMNGESNSIAFLRRLLRQAPRPRVVVVTMIAHRQMLAGLLDLGVEGVVDKRDGMQSLSAAVMAVTRGERFVSNHASEVLGDVTDGPNRAGVLSPREWEVFQLYASGLPVASIAQLLGRSNKTVATQKRSALRKLALENEADLLGYLRQIGLA